MRTSALPLAIAAVITLHNAARADVRIGLGAAASGEAGGLSLDVDVGPAIVEATVFSASYDGTAGSFRETVGSIGALARVAHDGKVSLYTGLRLDHAWNDPPPPPGLPYFGPELGVPLRIQLDVTPWLSIDAEESLEVSRAGMDRGYGLNGPQLGFTVWF